MMISSIGSSAQACAEFESSAWGVLPSEYAIEVPAGAPVALEAPQTAQDDREVVAGDFGLIDWVGADRGLDGIATRQDFDRAGSAGVLRGAEADVITAIARDESRFRTLDRRDGLADGRVVFSALVKAQTGETPLAGAASEVPSLFEAHYAHHLVALLNAICEQSGMLDQRAVATLSNRPVSDTTFRLIDAFDGSEDARVDTARLRGAFDARSLVLEQPSAAGQGSVMQASMSALMADYQRIEPQDSLSGEDRSRLSFLQAFSARLALDTGLPMARGRVGFDSDMDSSFIASSLLNENAVSAELERLLNQPTIQADLAQKVRDNTPNLQSRVREVESRISSPLYADRLIEMERAGRSDKAKTLASGDLAALRLLDEKAAERASSRLLENMAGAMIHEGDFENTPRQVSSLAITDTLEVMLGLKAARVGLRETGRINTLINTLGDIKHELLASKQAIARMGESLADLFSYTQSAGGKLSDAPRLLQDLEMPAMKAAIPQAERTMIRGLIDTLDKAGVWQTGAAIFGVIGGVYRLAHPGATPWDRMYAAQEFLAAASYITGPAKALGQYLHKKADTGSGFHAAMKTSLVDLVKPSMAYSNASSGAESVDGSVGDKTPVSVGGQHRAAAAFVKGFATLTEVGSAVMGIAIGAKVIAEGVAHGDTGQKVLGSITLTSGVATMTGAALASAFAIGTPLLVAGGVLSFVGLMTSLALQKSGDQVMGDQLASAWGETFMKEGWRDALRQWWVAHTNMPDGLGVDL